MTDGHPGWFKDPSDPALARWHDGDDWTEHTLVIADQAPGVEPPPPVITPPADTAADVYFPRHSSSPAVPASAPQDNESGVPGWAKVLVPVVVVLVAILGFSFLAGGDDDDPETATVDTRPASLDDAVEVARDSGLPNAVTDTRAASLITRICGAADRPADVPQLGNDLGQLPVNSVSELRTSVAALGEGAEERCPDQMAEADELISDLQDQAFVAFSTTTTAPTVPGEAVPGEGTDGTDAGTDDGDDGQTTRTTRRTTSTTRAATSTTTTTAPTTTTTKSDIQQGFACSPAGATAIDKFGKEVTCRPSGCGPSQKLTWQRGTSPCASSTTIAPPADGNGGSTTTG